MELSISSMKFFAKTSFLSLFLLVFSASLLILGSLQALFGTLRWYNASEQKHEELQNYPVYSAWEDTKPKSTIRVFIAPKPAATESNVYVFMQNTAPMREEALSTVSPEKAQIIQQRVDDIQYPTPYESSAVPEVFQTPVQLRLKPEKSTMPKWYPATIDTVLTGTYFRDVLWSFPLTVDLNRISPRGQMSNESVTLSGRIKSTSEMAKVLVHELAHMVDIYFLRQRGKTPDPSKDFYAISWSEPTVMHSGMGAKSFASGYAATNQYEDFAEAFTLYVFHNTTFAERAKNNPILQQKYDFLRYRVFGDYFIGTNFEQNPLPESLWDVTKIVIKSDALRDIFVSLGRIMQTLT